jgi:hypothetical protein
LGNNNREREGLIKVSTGLFADTIKTPAEIIEGHQIRNNELPCIPI